MQTEIEVLKKEWENKKLTFIAKFFKRNYRSGYFYDFIYPKTKQEVYYTNPENGSNKKLRFDYIKNINKLEHKKIYKIELTLNNSQCCTINQFSLEIKTIKELNIDKTETYTIPSSNNIFISKVEKTKAKKTILNKNRKQTTPFNNENKHKTIYPNCPWNILVSYVNNIDTIELSTDKRSYSNTIEYILIDNLMSYVNESMDVSYKVKELIDILRSKIKIDGNPLINYDVNNKVQFGWGEEFRELQLSKIITKYKYKAESIEVIIRSFDPINRRKLHNTLFKTKPLDPTKIYDKIESERRHFYTPYQTLFHLLYKKHFNIRRSKNRIWPEFDKYWNEQKNSKLEPHYIEFLELAMKLNLGNLLRDYKFIGWEFSNCVDKQWAIEEEILPNWLQFWVNKDIRKRIPFISQIGYNNISSPIVKFRQALIETPYCRTKVFTIYKKMNKNSKLLWNTIIWLNQFNSDAITQNIDIISEINKLRYTHSNHKNIIIPIINSIDKGNMRRYKLESIPINNKLYVLKNKQKYSSLLFYTLKAQHKQLIIVDSTCGNLLDKFSFEEINLKQRVNYEQLINNSVLWDKPFYKKWELYKKHPIYIYKETEIPYIYVYKYLKIKDFTSGSEVTINGKYFVTAKTTSDIMFSLEKCLPQTTFRNLKEWHYKTLLDNSLLKNQFFKTNNKLDLLIQNRLNLSLTKQKEKKFKPLCQAIYYLSDLGYNIKEIKRVGPFLTNIKTCSGLKIKSLVLYTPTDKIYIESEHWNFLKDPFASIIVIFQTKKPSFFKQQKDLLYSSSIKQIQINISKPKSITKINQILNNSEYKGRLVLE